MLRTSYAVGGPQNSAGVLESRGDHPSPKSLGFPGSWLPEALPGPSLAPAGPSPPAAGGAGCDPSGVRRPRATCSPKSRSEPHPDTRWDGARRPQSARAGEAAGAAAQDSPIQNDLLGGWDAAPGYWRLFRSRPWTWIPRATQLHTAGYRGTGCLGVKGATFPHLRRAAVAQPGAGPQRG